jgi:hypothetical protein
MDHCSQYDHRPDDCQGMNAARLDTKNAKMPRASSALMNATAEAVYCTMREFWDETSALGGPREKRVEILPWAKLDTEHRLRWINAAKEAYCIIALAGGAKRIECAEIEPGSKDDH